MTKFFSRLEMELHVVGVAFAVALPVLLDRLGYVDFSPLLHRFGVPDDITSLVVAMLPFVLAFLKPIVKASSADEMEDGTG